MSNEDARVLARAEHCTCRRQALRSVRLDMLIAWNDRTR
jgi:hypothetical protein